MNYLDYLESESIYILRELVAECSKPALLFSGGKDSIVVLAIALKAFNVFNNVKKELPFPLIHIDTGHNYDEVINFRDNYIKKNKINFLIEYVEDSIKKGTVYLRFSNDSRNSAQTITLLESINKYGFTAMIGGARRDEEKSRSKERIFSFRDEFGQWNPKLQRPELWNLYNTFLHKGEHLRVFPISNWTELDVWRYILREKLELPSIYYAHKRIVVRRNGLLFPVTKFTPILKGEKEEELLVRFRTIGDISCTCPIESEADNIEKIIFEIIKSKNTERGLTRMDDRISDIEMEKRKKQGYF